MEFYTATHVKRSRKAHLCHICRCEIPIGSSYFRESGMYDGEFFDRCTCNPCDRIRNDYLSFYEVQEYDTEGICIYAQDGVCHDCPQFETCIENPLSCQTVKAYYSPNVTTKEEDHKND